MAPEDSQEVRRFVRRLPEADLFFLMDDICNPAGMNVWMEGSIVNVLAERTGRILGYGTFRCGHLPWARLLGEIRVMVAPAERGKGIGKLLAGEAIAVARDFGLRRVMVRLTSEQTAARRVFEQFGFHVDAVLAGYASNHEEGTQDLIFMSGDMAAPAAKS
jgi:GNAT superfamily N-acetyltransferase